MSDAGPYCVVFTVITAARVVENGYHAGDFPFDVALETEGGDVEIVGVHSLRRVRELVEILSPRTVKVWAGEHEDDARLYAQVTGTLPIYLH